jgi:hypothetical protein
VKTAVTDFITAVNMDENDAFKLNPKPKSKKKNGRTGTATEPSPAAGEGYSFVVRSVFQT